MAEAISNTSPLFYLHQVQGLDCLSRLFSSVWTPTAVINELTAGKSKGYSIPARADCPWLEIVDPQHTPSEWLSSDLGRGELAVLALGIEHPNRILILDDGLARRVAQAAGLTVWGTLKVLIESKARGIIPEVKPILIKLENSGMWISSDLCRRVLPLADES